MTSQIEHTPGPWELDDEFSIYDGRDRRIAILRDHGTPEHATLIVRAVNAHDDILAALKLARECIAYCRRAHADEQSGTGIPVEVFIDAAIAKAEGR